jgi:hypothetical protein
VNAISKIFCHSKIIIVDRFYSIERGCQQNLDIYSSPEHGSTLVYIHELVVRSELVNWPL